MSKRSAQRNRHRNRRKAGTTDTCQVIFGGIDLGTAHNMTFNTLVNEAECGPAFTLEEMEIDCLLLTAGIMAAAHRARERHSFIYGNKPEKKAEAIQVEALSVEEE